MLHVETPSSARAVAALEQHLLARPDDGPDGDAEGIGR